MTDINTGEIKKYLDRYKESTEKDVEINDVYKFNLRDTVKKIDLYHSNKFQSGSLDSQGDKKYFFNILRPQAGNATKNIDLDRKDLRIYATEGSKDYLRSLIYNAEIKEWTKEKKIGRILNLISEYLPIFGSVVLKKEGKNIRIVPLKNLSYDPSVSNIEGSFDIQSPYVIEEYYLQPDELRKMNFNKEETDKVIEDYKKKSQDGECTSIEVYEMHAELPDELFNGGDGYSKYRIYLVENGDGINILEYKKEDKFPYKKLDYITVFGRGLGLGVYEIGFDQQERFNEMVNQKAKSMKLSSKILLQTRDTNIEGNILSDLLDGDIVKVKNEITRVPNEERNLGAYSQEESKVMENIRSNTNAYEVTTGENLPSGTSYRLGAMQNENASKLFNFIRQNYGLFLEEVFTEWVLPMFDSEKVKEHIFDLYDREALDAVIEADVNYRVNEAVKKYVIKKSL